MSGAAVNGTGRPDVGVLMAVEGEDADLVRSLDARGTGLVVVRRCGDTPELLAAALAGLGSLAVVSTDFDELDRTVIDRLAGSGLRGVILSRDPAAWLSTGWKVMSRTADPEEVRACVQDLARQVGAPEAPVEAPTPADQWGPEDDALLAAQAAGPTAPGSTGGEPVRGREADRQVPVRRGPGTDLEGLQTPGHRHGDSGWLPTSGAPGRLIAVWGPHGAPGRSTVAISLAHGLSVDGGAVLADADVEAPSLVQLLGLPDDSSSLATAARLGSHSRLDEESFSRLLVPVAPGLSLLSGLGRAGRWRELPPVAMDEVWRHCRQAAAWTVVDIAGGAIDNEVDDFTLEPGHGAMAASLLAQADVVVVVGSADPVGIHRLLQLLADIDGTGQVPGRVEVVVNRVRAAAAGPSPDRTVREALERFGGLQEAVLLPEDSVADASALAGVTIQEADPSSDLARSLAILIDRIDPDAGARTAAARARRRGILARVRQALSSLVPARTPLDAGGAQGGPGTAPAGTPVPAASGAAVPPADAAAAQAAPSVPTPNAPAAGPSAPPAPAAPQPPAPAAPAVAGPGAPAPAAPAAPVGGLVPGGLPQGGLAPQPPAVPAPAQAPQAPQAPSDQMDPASLTRTARMPKVPDQARAMPAVQEPASAGPPRPVQPGLTAQAVQTVQPARPSGNALSAPPAPPQSPRRQSSLAPPPPGPPGAGSPPAPAPAAGTEPPATPRRRTGRRVDTSRPVDGPPSVPAPSLPAIRAAGSSAPSRRAAHRATATTRTDTPVAGTGLAAPPPPPAAPSARPQGAPSAPPLPPPSASAPAAGAGTPGSGVSRRGRLEAVPPLGATRSSAPSPDSAVSLPSSLVPVHRGGRLEAVPPLGATRSSAAPDPAVSLPPSVAPGRGRLEVVPPLPASPDTGTVEPLPEPRPTTRREMREISRRRAAGRHRG